MPIQVDAPLSSSITKAQSTIKKMNNKKKSIAKGSPKIRSQSSRKNVFKSKSTMNPTMVRRISFPDSNTRQSSYSPSIRRNFSKKVQSKESKNKKSFKSKRESKPKMSIAELDTELEAYMNNSN